MSNVKAQALQESEEAIPKPLLASDLVVANQSASASQAAQLQPTPSSSPQIIKGSKQMPVSMSPVEDYEENLAAKAKMADTKRQEKNFTIMEESADDLEAEGDPLTASKNPPEEKANVPIIEAPPSIVSLDPVEESTIRVDGESINETTRLEERMRRMIRG